MYLLSDSLNFCTSIFSVLLTFKANELENFKPPKAAAPPPFSYLVAEIHEYGAMNKLIFY
jgi:hypothetical protein